MLHQSINLLLILAMSVSLGEAAVLAISGAVEHDRSTQLRQESSSHVGGTYLVRVAARASNNAQSFVACAMLCVVNTTHIVCPVVLITFP